MGIFSALFPDKKKKFYQKLDMAVDQVKHGTYNHLFLTYLKDHERDFAGALAAAVTNELFNEAPVGSEGEAFVKENRAQIEEAILRISDNDEMCWMVSDAVRLRADIVFKSTASGGVDRNFGRGIDRLRKAGIIPEDHTIPAPKLFVTKADKFFRKSLKKVKYK
ncbi:MAG: hypothetical protein MI742_09125 [Desulfobacterales bacterium]|nr:hypothetical protein [Desulfobacterales bacterium]